MHDMHEKRCKAGRRKYAIKLMLYEKWLLKERLNGVQGAAGSNPVDPTRKIAEMGSGKYSNSTRM